MAGIGFFAPLPLAMMLPFMAGQSMIMGDAFGKAYQYGKRKISAMSNEEFNKLDADGLGKQLLEDYTLIVPHLKQAVHQSREFQSLIIQELGEIIKSLPQELINLLNPEQSPTLSSGGTDSNGSLLQSLLSFMIGSGAAGLQQSGSVGGQIIGQAFGDNPPPGQTEGPPSPPEINAYEQWASRWINYTKSTANFTSATIGELRFMLDKIAAGLGGKTTKWRSTILQIWEQKNADKITKTPEQAIGDSGATGIVKQIATLYATLQNIMKMLVQKRTWQVEKLFLKHAKIYNQFVALNKKPGLQIDTAKSIAQRRLIPKT